MRLFSGTGLHKLCNLVLLLLISLLAISPATVFAKKLPMVAEVKLCAGGSCGIVGKDYPLDAALNGLY